MHKKWFRHFLFWFPYLILEVYTEFYWMQIQYQQPIWETFIHTFWEEFLQILLLKIPMVYLLFYFISKFADSAKNFWKLLVSLTLTIILFSVLGYFFLTEFIVPVIYSHLKIVGIGGFGTLINSFMDKIFIACVAIALKQYNNSQKLKVREQLLINEKIQTELSFLKSQINPHFLFNTLNNIYSLARKKAEETPEVVLKLSKLLRYVLYETENRFTEISREISFLKDYLDLQKIRFDQRLKLDLITEIDYDNTEIAPLMLIPLVENAFKHGASQSTQDSFIQINLKVKNGILDFKIENSFENNGSEKEAGIGLKNLKRQLQLCYFDYELNTETKRNIFIATLKIDLNKTL